MNDAKKAQKEAKKALKEAKRAEKRVSRAKHSHADSGKTESVTVKSAQSKGKMITGVIVFIFGLVALVGGVVFLVLKLTQEPGLRDAEYLVEVGTWAEQDAPSVVWQFTEVGKGTLTTNAHANDYDFLWSLSGETMAVETDWLYTLNNEYIYKLDQQAGTLTLVHGDEINVFVPVKVD